MCHANDALDCPVEVEIPAWVDGPLWVPRGFARWMPQGAVIGGKGANCDCAPWGRTLRKKPDGGNTELL